MDMSERMGWLILGCAVGFVLGYIVRALREIKEELDTVDECVKRCQEEHDHIPRPDDGYAVPSYVGHIALIVVLFVTVYAAFASQDASNDVREAQKDLRATQVVIQNVSVCTQETLAATISALNERTTYTVAQAKANVDLQKAQSSFIAVLVTVPEPSLTERRAALNEYFDKLTSFVALSSQTVNKIEQNPYPTNEDLTRCLEGEQPGGAR